MKQFPFDFESKKDVLFYPQKPDNPTGDVLEIGPGRGDLMMALAFENPHLQFVAIELGKKRYFKLAQRLERKHLKNVLLIRGDARVVLPQYFKDTVALFKKIFVLFPDPWPKKRHAFHRLLNLEFLHLLTHHLKNQGTLIIGTDVKDYMLWVNENLQQIKSLVNELTPLSYTSQLDEIPKTFFEEKWRQMGKEIFFLKFCKQGKASSLQ